MSTVDDLLARSGVEVGETLLRCRETVAQAREGFLGLLTERLGDERLCFLHERAKLFEKVLGRLGCVVGFHGWILAEVENVSARQTLRPRISERMNRTRKMTKQTLAME